MSIRGNPNNWISWNSTNWKRNSGKNITWQELEKEALPMSQASIKFESKSKERNWNWWGYRKSREREIGERLKEGNIDYIEKEGVGVAVGLPERGTWGLRGRNSWKRCSIPFPRAVPKYLFSHFYTSPLSHFKFNHFSILFYFSSTLNYRWTIFRSAFILLLHLQLSVLNPYL